MTSSCHDRSPVPAAPAHSAGDGHPTAYPRHQVEPPHPGRAGGHPAGRRVAVFRRLRSPGEWLPTSHIIAHIPYYRS